MIRVAARVVVLLVLVAACGDDTGNAGAGAAGGNGSAPAGGASQGGQGGESQGRGGEAAGGRPALGGGGAGASGTGGSPDEGGSGGGGPLPETCDNAIDDNGDGAIDCDDEACNGDAGAPPDLACPFIQSVQDGTIATGSAVTVVHVWVTAKKVGPSGNARLWVQEPEGIAPASHAYPRYAGMGMFAASAIIASLPDLAASAVGDCVTISGTTEEFNGRTGLTQLTAFKKVTAGCGSPPIPHEVGAVPMFDQVASDTDPSTAGDQPGAEIEVFEGVLLRIVDVQALADVDAAGDFVVTEAGGDSRLLIENYLYSGDLPAAAAQSFPFIQGVYDQFELPAPGAKLMPRDASDLP